MAQKTKAAMPGRQCSTENKEQKQDTRPAAGGQRMSQRNFAPSDFIQFCTIGTAALAQLVRPSQSPKISGDTISKIVGCILRRGCTALQHTPYLMGCEPMAHTLLLHTSFSVAQLQLGTSPKNWGNQGFGCGTYTKKVGNSKRAQYCTKSAKPCYPEIGDRCEENRNGQNSGGQTPELESAQPFGSSLDFLRWRRLISLSKAATTNCPVLSPSAFRFSIASTKLSGTRASIRFDLAFTDLVAICGFRCIWCPTIIIENKCNSSLDVSHTLLLACVPHLDFAKVRNGNAPDCCSSTEASNHNVIGANTMAESQHTQTRPEFTWLFLATPKHYPECAPVVLRFDADTETNARAAFPGWELVFAAKIRAQAPCRVSFFDYSTRRGWEFDSAAIEEVRHA